MPSAVRLREDYSAEELRTSARRSKNVNQSRRLLSLAAVRDGLRSGMEWIGAPPRRSAVWTAKRSATGSIASTLPGPRDCSTTGGPKPRLSAEQLAQFAQIVEAGPDREVDGVVRWRRLDSSVSSPRGSASTFIHAMSESSSRSLASPPSVRGPVIRLRTSGSSRRSKTYGPPRCKGFVELAADQSASTYPASRHSLRP